MTISTTKEYSFTKRKRSGTTRVQQGSHKGQGEVIRDQKLGDRVIFILIKKEKQDKQDVLPELTSTMNFI